MIFLRAKCFKRVYDILKKTIFFLFFICSSAWCIGDILPQKLSFNDQSRIHISPFFYPISNKPYLFDHGDYRIASSRRPPMDLSLDHDDNLRAQLPDRDVLLYSSHQYQVHATLPWEVLYKHNALPMQGDVFYHQSWRTLLVGAFANNKKGIYALELSEPMTENNARVLLEFSSQQDHDLGFIVGQANIARVADGRWSIIVHNGYQKNGQPYLYIFDIEHQSLLAKLGVEPDRPFDQDSLLLNGLSEAAPVDIDGDYIVDYVYAGDLNGNVWRYDLRNETPSSWLSGQRIFSAKDRLGSPQAITERPQVGAVSSMLETHAQVMVYIGTGSGLVSGYVPSSHQSIHAFQDILDHDSRLLFKSSTAATSDVSWSYNFSDESEQVLSGLSLNGQRLVCDTQSITHDDKGLGQVERYRYVFDRRNGAVILRAFLTNGQQQELIDERLANQPVYGRQSWRVIDKRTLN